MADSPADLPHTPVSDAVQTLIGVGVTGHRLARLDDAALPGVSAVAGQVLDAIAAALGRPEAGALRLITALADGADSLVADEAIVRHWTLDAVLPFARDDYARDFGEGEPRAAYVQRLAASRAVLELPGSRANGESVAYERAGHVVLAQCDILIAVWDGGAARGRGGAAQIVAEAVLQNIPVIHIDAAGVQPPQLLWDGLTEHSLGQQTVETVPRGDLSALPKLLRGLVDPPGEAGAAAMRRERGETVRGRSRLLSLAYPLLLAVTGVRAMRRSDLRAPLPDALDAVMARLCGAAGTAAPGFNVRLTALLAPRFARADATASATAQTFRSGYVINFSFSALAVVLSLLGLALPGATKPVLVMLEVAVIAVILILTRAGNRAGWHRRWLDNRHLAERLRCLTISAQLGDLDLRADADGRPGWVGWQVRATARALGLPHARVDAAYLGCVKQSLTALIDDQIVYLKVEAHRMHRLEHRLHLLGTWLFGTTAAICLFVLVYKFADKMAVSTALSELAHPLLTLATIATAGLPAIGAAIYGIRMQGDFAGTAERSEGLAHALSSLRTVIDDDAPEFDTLVRRARRASDLLTEDLASWLQTYHARPLTLPG
jgi:hypothetical protein